jgi:hypothetical protein
VQVPDPQVISVIDVALPENLYLVFVPSVGTVIVIWQLVVAVNECEFPSPAIVVGVTEQPDKVKVEVVAPFSATVSVMD